MKLDKATIETLLTALDRQIGAHGGKFIELVVCGGSALNVLGHITRTTKDIDVVGLLEKDPSGKVVIQEAHFPEWFMEAGKAVQIDFNLPDNWINCGPTSIISLGLPNGFESRLVKKDYGWYLSVNFISRLDQIHFKLYASADRGGYHIDDLIALRPEEVEVEMAARWCLTHDVSEGFRIILKDLLNRLEFKNVSERI